MDVNIQPGTEITHLSGWKAKVQDSRGNTVTVKADNSRYSGTYHASAFKEYEKESDSE